MRNPSHRLMAGSLLLIAATAAHAGTTDGKFSIAGGADYSSGKYGTGVNTDILSVPLTAAFESDRWTFKLVVPYVRINGAGDVIPGAGPVDNGNPHGRGLGHVVGGVINPGGGTTGGTAATSRGSASGLGDIVASAGYEMFANADRTFGLDLTGKIKFGTADANKGLGTGKNDYGLSLDAYKVAGDWTAFGGIGWMDYGSSQYIHLNNAFNANVGLDFKLDASDNVGAYYYYRQKIASAGASQSEVTGYWNRKLNASWRMQAYVLGGFSDGSPDWGGGASLKYTF